jgi:starvation-inducible outer membrane lipoprotein
MNRMLMKFVAAAIATLLTGCATDPTPVVEARMSDAVRTARVQQTIDPAASQNADPVVGIDAQSAKTSMDRYHKSFDAPPPTFTIINVGGAAGR